MTWEAVTAFVGSFGGIAIAILAYRRSVKVDRAAAQVGAAGESRAGTEQVIEGLNKLVDQLQEGADTNRADMRGLNDRLTALIAENDTVHANVRWLTDRLAAVVVENDALKVELANCRRRYGEQ